MSFDEKMPFMAAEAPEAEVVDTEALRPEAAPSNAAACRHRRRHCIMVFLLSLFTLVILPSIVGRSIRHFRGQCAMHQAPADVQFHEVIGGAEAAVQPVEVMVVEIVPAAVSVSVSVSADVSDKTVATEEEEDAAAAVAGDSDVAAASLPPADSVFANLLDAVSSDSLHDLLHTYMPKTYKHGVYASEKSALIALHRVNAPLATSIVHLARRDTNATTSTEPLSTSSAEATSSSSSVLPTTTDEPTTASASASSAAPTSSTPSSTATTSSEPTTTSEAPSAGTPEVSSAEPTTSSGQRVTSTYTSTINGTPTVVTATSVVGVAASATSSGSSSTASASLQTGGGMSRAGTPKMALVGMGSMLAVAVLLI